MRPAAIVVLSATLAAAASACGGGAVATQASGPSAAPVAQAPGKPFGPYRFVRPPIVSFSLAVRQDNVPTYSAYIRLSRALPKTPNGDTSGILKVNGLGGPSNLVLADRAHHCYVQYLGRAEGNAALEHPRPGKMAIVTLRVSRRPAGLLRETTRMRNVQQTGSTDPDTVNLRALGCRG